MKLLVSQLYCAYLKFLIKFMRKSKVLSIRISEVTRQIKKMKNKDLFATYESFDNMITQIITMFENNDFCRKYRAHQNFIYMIFLDLVKIYNVFYIMTMETLDRYKRMSVTEMNKALILYKNFCSFTDTLKKEANTIPMLFGFSFKEPNYYKPDAKKERAMKNAKKDKEAGGDGFVDEDDDFAEEMPDFEDQDKADFADEYKEEDDEDSDDDYQFDILGDVKKQEQMASVSGGKYSRKSVGGGRKDKIQVDDFNTAALDDLLGGGAPPARRSDTMVAPSQKEEEWDPFANKESNVYNDSSQAHQTAQPAASSNIFGDDDGIWGGNQDASNEPVSKQDQKEALEDILGGDDFNQASSEPAAGSNPAGGEYNMLKGLYNTAAAASNQTPMGGAQPGYYNTGMGAGAGGYTDNSMGYNNMGGGYQQYNTGMGGGYGGQQQFNTGYGGGYGDTSGGYNNYGAQPGQFNTGYGGGGYGGGAAPGSYQENPQYTGTGGGYGTTTPGTQSNQNNNFDPFA